MSGLIDVSIPRVEVLILTLSRIKPQHRTLIPHNWRVLTASRQIDIVFATLVSSRVRFLVI